MGLDLLLPLLLLVVLMVVFSRNRRRQQQQAAALASGLVPGTRVMTTSGLHATVVEVGSADGAVAEGLVLLEIAPGVRTTWVRAAISRRLDHVAAEASAASATPGEPVRPPATSTPPSTTGTVPPTGAGATGVHVDKPRLDKPRAPEPTDGLGDTDVRGATGR